MNSKVFGMVSTENSRHYTYFALKSFFEHTPLEPSDSFFLIDNDQSLGRRSPFNHPFIKLITNENPRSFSENVNEVMRIALEAKADLFFLNNDLVFTADWIKDLLIDEASILSPLSNREMQYKSERLTLNRVMDLTDLFGREQELASVVAQFREQSGGYREVLSLPFFCVKLPFTVFKEVGFLDEEFLIGGGEDNDYCLRAYLKGFSVRYALGSFVLHFIGKSTWAGGESSHDTSRRVSGFEAVFERKWGKALLDILIHEKLDPLLASASKEFAERGDYKGLIGSLLPNRASA